MFSELLKKYLDENVKVGDPHFSMLWQCLGAIEASGVKAENNQSPSETEEAIRLTKECFNASWEIIYDKPITSVDIMESALKLTSIMMDHIKHKQRTEALSSLLGPLKKSVDYSGFIKNIRNMLDGFDEVSSNLLKNKADFQKTYGSMADDPIERGEQGKYEKRVDIEYEQHGEKLITSDDFLNPDIEVNYDSF